MTNSGLFSSTTSTPACGIENLTCCKFFAIFSVDILFSSPTLSPFSLVRSGGAGLGTRGRESGGGGGRASHGPRRPKNADCESRKPRMSILSCSGFITLLGGFLRLIGLCLVRFEFLLFRFCHSDKCRFNFFRKVI